MANNAKKKNSLAVNGKVHNTPKHPSKVSKGNTVVRRSGRGG